MTTDKNDGKNPYIAYTLTKGNDSDGVPYDEYDFTPPPLTEGDRYIRTLVDTRNNTVVHVALVVRNKLECSGNLMAYITTRRGLFIHRIRIIGPDLSFVCAFPDNHNPARLQQIRNTANLRVHGERESGNPGLGRTKEVLDLQITEVLKDVDQTTPAFHRGFKRLSSQMEITPQPGTLLAETVEKRGGVIYAVGEVATKVLLNHKTMSLLKMFKDAGMTLDEAAVIVAIEPQEDRIKEVEKWLRAHGGMDRINEASLSETLFGPVPGSRERALQADLEVAKTKCVMITRPNSHGHDVNYGLLAVSRISGIPFLCDVYTLEQLGMPAMHMTKIPPFEQEVQLHINFINAVGQDSHAVVYALEKEDLNPLGRLLSTPNRRVAASFMAAHLKIWIDGAVERGYTSPDEFFACKPEWIEQAKF